MKPPFCSYCGARFDPFETDGTTLQFAVSPEDAAANARSKESRRPGHPKGLHWLCAEHVEAAQGLTHLRWLAAMKKMEADGHKKRRPNNAAKRNW